MSLRQRLVIRVRAMSLRKISVDLPELAIAVAVSRDFF
jgi:hypothetical protein